MKSYYELHKIEISKKSKEQYKNNREKRIQYSTDYVRKHKKETLKYQADYREKHRKELNVYFKKRYQEKKEILLEKQKEYRKNHPEKIKNQKHKDYLKHKQAYLDRAKRRNLEYKEEIKKYCKDRYELNKEEILKKCKIYREKNHDKISKRRLKYQRKRFKTDLNYRLMMSLRHRINMAIKGFTKSKHTIELLGCNVEFLKKHLESQFQKDMSWNNYGYYGWHVDHIIPCASFDLRKASEQKICFNYTNLQPLWWRENLRKQDKILINGGNKK